ncbi:hypothetical protein K2173_011567 [Erythroxylum novogranatense]|uniref:Uncharacterized protein n=1 Tax=Erythroxylum novogranatense TaxID=1862640 RepID=A0AAV8TVX5_9ROSI|nr:hypothetical protein K2173_011567 [Erythroxylum novogranatense]
MVFCFFFHKKETGTTADQNWTHALVLATNFTLPLSFSLIVVWLLLAIFLHYATVTKPNANTLSASVYSFLFRRCLLRINANNNGLCTD